MSQTATFRTEPFQNTYTCTYTWIFKNPVSNQKLYAQYYKWIARFLQTFYNFLLNTRCQRMLSKGSNDEKDQDLLYGKLIIEIEIIKVCSKN